MIIPPEPCDKCGNAPTPTEVQCDKCGDIHEIEVFPGIVIHFANLQPCDEDCENCDEYDEVPEFHFCSPRCLSDFACDPESGLEKYYDTTMTIFVEPDNVKSVLYMLGKGML